MARCKTLLLALLIGSCAARTRRQCELLPPTLIASSQGLAFDGIALAGSGESLSYVWSDREGLSVRRGSQTTRLGERCRGGIDARMTDAGLVVACSRPADDGGAVVVYQVDARAEIPIGNAGRDGRGVMLTEDGRELVFHEGALGDHAIWTARIGEAPRRISAQQAAVSQPSIVRYREHSYVAYAELDLRDPGAPRSVVWISRDRAAPERVTTTRVFTPTPKLAHDARGLLLGYRDQGKENKRTELRAARLDERGRISGAPSSVGRANVDGEPNLYGCGDLVAALLPREYGGERYVGVHPLDGDLNALGAGHQLYQSGRDFVQAAGTCSERGLTFLAADRAAPSKPGVQAVALRFQCAD